MDTPSFLEDHISQVPALQLLQQLGYSYLTPDEALQLRGNKTGNVILDDILRRQLHEINSIRVSSTRSAIFTDANIEAGILALKELPLQDSYMSACAAAYDLLTLGKALEQSVDGDKKSFTLQYIDWKNIHNNVFHVTEEFSVMRSNSREHQRPDLVLFVNGIPLCVIECKRPDMQEPLKQAISQQLRNQQEDGIRPLFMYAQVLLCIATNTARYATSGTRPEFWAHWEEPFGSREAARQWQEQLTVLKNTPLSNAQKDRLFAGRYRYVRHYFDAMEQEQLLVTEQDRYLCSLCSPERLLDFTFNYTLFDDGDKKIARYQQVSAIRKTMQRIAVPENGKRKGGYIWHTQGSGKSLTMVLLAQAIALNKTIRNPKIILVTDRTDLDQQITYTFKKCGLVVENAATGQRLVELLQSKSDAIVTTVINKFETAVRRLPVPLDSGDIFVLVDEGHRSQHGLFNIDMQKTMPNACYIAFTGTPLFKKDKNTADRFGGEIDRYTVDKAVKDMAVVPLLYEGRHAVQAVNEKPIDDYFSMVAEPLTEYQKADLKNKFSRADQLNVADQKINQICWDISRHFRDNFQHKTPFKGQLVTASKAAAIKYKTALDSIGIVSSAVIISPPDEREGEEDVYGETTDQVKAFWKRMMDEHGTPRRYEQTVISRFKNQQHPELLIVVDKLLTGFDEPKNTVLYLTRKLQGHNLLQAIARVNRIYPDKAYGYIVDYYGVLGELDEALETYSSLDTFDPDDLQGTLTGITDELKKLPQLHADVWALFKTISNKKDPEAFEQLLRDEAVRMVFYERLAAYARMLKLALSAISFHKTTDEKQVAQYKTDLAFFMSLRKSVVQRYSDTIDYKQYEGQIQKLIDTHIRTDEVLTITGLINIFDRDKFLLELAEAENSAAKADRIATRTSKYISEKMEEDPAFYRRFSEMLKETIREYESKRISESTYLQRVTDVMNTVLSGIDSDTPDELRERPVTQAFYRIAQEALRDNISDEDGRRRLCIKLAQGADEIILKLRKVDWDKPGSDIPKRMVHLIGDYMLDEVFGPEGLQLSFEEVDTIAERLVAVARKRYHG